MMLSGRRQISRLFATFRSFDPYKTLNSSKQDDFNTIKKRYFKLVSQYHPDRNEGEVVCIHQETKAIFKDILEAYESIKIERGLSTKKPLMKGPAEDDGFKSKRPFAGQYAEDFQREKEKYGDFDSAEFYYRSETGGKTRYTGRHRLTQDSFKEMSEANSTEFKPAEGDLPNTMNRFGLEKVRAKIKNWSDRSFGTYVAMFSIGVLGVLLCISWQQNAAEEAQEDQLEQFTEKITSYKTNLEKSDLATSKEGGYERVKIEAETIRLTKREQEEYLKRTGVAKISQQEKRLKVLSPDLNIIDPDS